MAKFRAIKNQKKSLKKMRNRIRRLGDSWYSKEWLYRLRINSKKEVKKQVEEMNNG